MKVLLFIILAIGLVMPKALCAKNMALELDGETAIEVPNSDSLNPKNAITIEAWMNMSKPVGECLAKDWGGKRDYIFPEIVQNGKGVRFVLWPGTKILDVPGLEPNEWQHVAGVWDGKEMRVYIDGEEKGTAPFEATEALGDVQAEKFIALIMRSPFDYTKWQRKLWVKKSVEKISDAAMKLRKSTDGGS